jgi:hypothetical protein
MSWFEVLFDYVASGINYLALKGRCMLPESTAYGEVVGAV